MLWPVKRKDTWNWGARAKVRRHANAVSQLEDRCIPRLTLRKKNSPYWSLNIIELLRWSGFFFCSSLKFGLKVNDYNALCVGRSRSFFRCIFMNFLKEIIVLVFIFLLLIDCYNWIMYNERSQYVYAGRPFKNRFHY